MAKKEETTRAERIQAKIEAALKDTNREILDESLEIIKSALGRGMTQKSLLEILKSEGYTGGKGDLSAWLKDKGLVKEKPKKVDEGFKPIVNQGGENGNNSSGDSHNQG